MNVVRDQVESIVYYYAGERAGYPVSMQENASRRSRKVASQCTMQAFTGMYERTSMWRA